MSQDTKHKYEVGIDFGHGVDHIAVVLMRRDRGGIVVLDGVGTNDDLLLAWKVALRLATANLPWWLRLWRILCWTNAMSRARVT